MVFLQGRETKPGKLSNIPKKGEAGPEEVN